MELIVIDENKLKIMLTAPDMRHYALPDTREELGGEPTRRAFRHIFEDARARTGFDTEGERLLVELYTSREGGCEIFVTKLGAKDTADVPAGQDTPPAPSGWKAPNAPTDPAELALLRRLYQEDEMDQPPTTVAYALPDVHTLLDLCRRLTLVGFGGASEAYITTPAARPVLFLTPLGGEEIPALVSEYADELPDPDATRIRLSEHGRRLGTAGELGRF